MRRAFLLICVIAQIAPLACKEERAERVAASYSSVTRPSESSNEPPPARSRPPDKIVVGTGSIPVEESYEERAASTVTEANLQAKIAELEKELSL